MAKKKNKKKRRETGGPAVGGKGAAIVEAEPEGPTQAESNLAVATEVDANGRPGTEVAPGGGGGAGGRSGGSGRGGSGGGRGDAERSGGPGGPAAPVRQGGFFEIYKRGQGYYTRMGTAIGSGILILAGANYVYEQLEGALSASSSAALYVQVGVPLTLVVGLGLLAYWLVGVKRRSCDFMIATEGEMKKVSWSSRQTVAGSTKVVIITVVLMAALLFTVDVLFMELFSWIDVLQVEGTFLTPLWSFLSRLFGME